MNYVRTKSVGVLAAVFPLVAVPVAGADTVPPLPSSATVWTVSPTWGMMAAQLQGALCQDLRTCTEIHYPPYNVPQGVIDLSNAIMTSTSDPTAHTTIVFGYSEGAEVAEQWVKQHASDPTAPSQDDLIFVMIGNPTRAFGGNLVETAGGAGNPNAEVWPQSKYQVIDVAREYEGTADFPNNPSSPYYLLAVFNAYAGWWYMHDTYSTVNLSDPANAVWTEGNTTYVLVPTQNLPLLEGFRGLGLNALADQLQAQLKPQVDQAYNRPVAFPTTTPPAPAQPITSTTASTLSASFASDPTVAPHDATVKPTPAPVVAADAALTSAASQSTNYDGRGRAAVDTAMSTLPDPATVLDTSISPAPAAQPSLDKAVVVDDSIFPPTKRTTAPATTRVNLTINGNKVVPWRAGGNNATATSAKDDTAVRGNQGMATKGNNATATSGDDQETSSKVSE